MHKISMNNQRHSWAVIRVSQLHLVFKFNALSTYEESLDTENALNKLTIERAETKKD